MKCILAILETPLWESNINLKQQYCDGGNNVMNITKVFQAEEASIQKQKDPGWLKLVKESGRENC